jgi:hypothetical protein
MNKSGKGTAKTPKSPPIIISDDENDIIDLDIDDFPLSFGTRKKTSTKKNTPTKKQTIDLTGDDDIPLSSVVKKKKPSVKQIPKPGDPDYYNEEDNDIIIRVAKNKVIVIKPSDDIPLAKSVTKKKDNIPIAKVVKKKVLKSAKASRPLKKDVDEQLETDDIISALLPWEVAYPDFSFP